MWNPDQPRDPAGIPTGGQWTAATRVASGPVTVSRGDWRALPDREFRPCGPDEFLSARDAFARSGGEVENLSPAGREELAGRRTFLSADGLTGYTVDRDGDFGNLFNNRGPVGAGQAGVVDGIRNGARTLDCYDGYLPKVYARYGYVVTGRVRFDPRFAPPGWPAAKDSPDVVFMRHAGKGWENAPVRPYRPGEGALFGDWAEAKARSRE